MFINTIIPWYVNTYYFAVFKDDYTSYRIVHSLMHKSDVQASIRKVTHQIKRETGYPVQTLRSDRGKEFTSQETIQFLEDNDIRQELTTPYIPEQNRATERENRTLVEATRSMLHHRNIPLHFWGEAIQTATYTLNRTYSWLQPLSTPYERWFGQKLSLAHMRIFGCDTFIHVPKDKRKKLESKSHPRMFLGYNDMSKAYWVWDKISKRVSITRDVLFHKNTTSTPSTAARPTDVPVLFLPFPNTAANSQDVQPSSTTDITAASASTSTTTNTANSDVILQPPPSIGPSIKLRPQRIQNAVDRYGDWGNLATTSTIESKTYKETTTCDDHEHWHQAMTEEYNSLINNHTWSPIKLPHHRQAVECKWTYKLKFQADGSIARYKA
jgi:hypothetical protein